MSLIVRRRKQWLLNLLLKQKVDVALLQETKLSTEAQEEEMSFFFERHFTFVHSKAIASSGGTGILIRKHRGLVIFPEFERDSSGRICAVDLIQDKRLFKCLSIYAPNEPAERKEFFASLRQYLDTPSSTILGGDFNCVLSAEDCSQSLRPDSSRVELRKLLRDFDLRDCTDIALAPVPGYTHWQGVCHARLDRIYVSGECEHFNPSYETFAVAFSDHGYVSVRLGARKNKSRKSQDWSNWKLNESLLEDEELSSRLRAIITTKRPRNAIEWEDTKEEVKLTAFIYSQELAARKRAEKQALRRTLQTLIQEENQTPGMFADDIKACKSSLLALMEQDYRGAVIRSRVQVIEKELEPVKIFKSKERQHASRNKISSLQVGDVILHSQEDIENQFLEMYDNLFGHSSNPPSNEDVQDRKSVV